MRAIKILLAVILMTIPIYANETASASDDVREGKVQWFISDINRLDKAQGFNTDVASVWPADKLAEGGYVLPGSHLNLAYRAKHYQYLSMLQYAPNGQITPIFLNRLNYPSTVRNRVMNHKIQVSPVEGRAGVILISSKSELNRQTIANIARNPDKRDYPDAVEAVDFCHFFIEDYMRTTRRRDDRRSSGGYNQPQERYQPGYSQPWGSQQIHGYNQPMFNPGTVFPGQGMQGFDPIPLNQMGSTYYFYPDGRVTRDYNPYYYYPYYFNRPMYYGYPGDMRYTYYPQGQRYYVIPGQDGARTNLHDFIFQANTKYGSFVFGDGGFLGGRFYFDGRNPTPDGLVFRFPVKRTWEHEGPHGSWIMDVPSDFDFYLNNRLLPIYGGRHGDPYVSIPLQGFLIDGINEFRLLPRRHDNLYGIGPIEIVADIRF